MNFFSESVETVEPDDWSRPSPCAGWTALGVPGHVGQATEAGIAVDEDLDLDRNRIVESPRGPLSVRDGLSFPATDLFLHGWDLGTATGQTVEIPGEAIDFIRGMIAAFPDDAVHRPGLFGPPVSVGEEASPTLQLVAFTGRDPGL
ncbi:MAG: maleylpyruvate isomerase N-terminal domain-containing protein [Gordonia sp. (in: high G+C Gram-positive bacteria)]